MDTKQMDWDQWIQDYRPITDGNGEPTMFETYGKDLDTVLSTHPRYVWTYLEGDSGSVITQGYHLVNRLGYYITENPSEDDTEYEIDYYEYNDNEEEPMTVSIAEAKHTLAQLSADTTIMYELLEEDEDLIFLIETGAPYEDLLAHAEVNY